MKHFGVRFGHRLSSSERARRSLAAGRHGVVWVEVREPLGWRSWFEFSGEWDDVVAGRVLKEIR